MEDQSIYTNSQPKGGVSENLQRFIDAMVEEIVLEGKPFDTQKKYLKKFSENEGLDYDKLEADIITFIEILDSLKTAFSKLQVKLAEEKGKECYISEEMVKKLVSHSLQPKLPEPIVETNIKEDPVTDNVPSLPKNKRIVWPWVASVLVLLAVVVIVFCVPSRDEKAFETCLDIVDYRQYVSQFGSGGKHYAEAKQFIADYVKDSTQKAEKEAKLLALKDVPLFSIYENGKLGFMDNNGNIVINPQFDGMNGRPTKFYEEVLYIKKDDKWGFINKLGDFVINPQYEDVYKFSEDLAAFKTNNKWGLLDKNGMRVIEPKYDWVDAFSEGFCEVKINGKYGFIDKKGRVIIEPKYENASGFSEGLAPVKVNGKWGYIDKTGKMKIEPKYDYTYSFSEGLSVVRNGYRYGFIDKSGKEIIPIKYVDAKSFSEGLAAVNVKGKYGFIDKSGSFVIKPRYTSARSFSDGMASVSLDGNWKYIDKAGNTLLSGCFLYASDFENGLAWVSGDGYECYIDKTGKRVYP